MKTTTSAETNCPLCGSNVGSHFFRQNKRSFHECLNCELYFLHPNHRPNPETELSHYNYHQNEPNDPEYRKFLSRLATPFTRRLPPTSKGLDYGCGPGAALAAMLEQAGHDVSLYDPYFEPDTIALQQTYEFITCTEVAEHFYNPAGEFERLNELLNPGGWLGIMTSFAPDRDKFASWHYHRELTHVVFYREKTFEFIAELYDWKIHLLENNVAILEKP